MATACHGAAPTPTGGAVRDLVVQANRIRAHGLVLPVTPRTAVAGAVAWREMGLILAIAALSICWGFDSDIKLANARVADGSALIATRCGPIEYRDAGTGVPLPAVHGSGGGYDQGMAYVGTLAHQGISTCARLTHQPIETSVLTSDVPTCWPPQRYQAKSSSPRSGCAARRSCRGG